MQSPTLQKKTYITTDEYRRLRHTLLSLRKRYAQVAYANKGQSMPPSVRTCRMTTLERSIHKLELRLALSEIIDTNDSDERVTFHDVASAVQRSLSVTRERVKPYIHQVTERFTPQRLRFGA